MANKEISNKKNWLKIVLLIGLAGLVIGGAVIYYMWNKPHRNIAAAEADFVISAADLLHEFERDETTANQKYLDKVIAVRGDVTGIETTPDGTINITLHTGNEMSAVICGMLPDEKEKAAKLQEGDNITVKGLCTGYLSDVVLTKCSIQ